MFDERKKGEEKTMGLTNIFLMLRLDLQKISGEARWLMVQ